MPEPLYEVPRSHVGPSPPLIGEMTLERLEDGRYDAFGSQCVSL